jgi:hypothetical protein
MWSLDEMAAGGSDALAPTAWAQHIPPADPRLAALGEIAPDSAPVSNIQRR